MATLEIYYRGTLGMMNWGQYARQMAIAIGMTFVVVAGIYLATRLLLNLL
jgi:hypothetical protein